MINLIPMAGVGNRFLEEKYRVPKPFISIAGEPMFAAALRSFPPADRHIFLCRQEHAERLRKFMPERYRAARIIEVPKPTEGQACTCLLARGHLPPEEGLFIASCDYQTVYKEAAYQALLTDPEVDVIIWTFRIGAVKKADPNAFAYCRTEGSRVTEVVEKRAISPTPHRDPAVVGSFTYKRASLFIEGAEAMIRKGVRVNGEYYVGTSINQLIAAGRRVAAFEVDKFVSFGNPLELDLFHYWEDFFHRPEDTRLPFGFAR
jgi:NDP-sugar pyrophosphorylase family protein